MPASGLRTRLAGSVERARLRWRWLDRAIRTQQRYTTVNGNVQAGGVTYFAFLSFFPLLALAFFVVGLVAQVWPGAQDSLARGIEQVLPGLVGSDEGELSLETIKANAGTAGLIGLAGVLYAGLNWVSALRGALLAIFRGEPGPAQPFLVGKLRDLATLTIIGTTLLAGVAVSGIVSGFSSQALDWLGLGVGSSWVLWLVSLAFGVATSAVMFFVMFRLLAKPALPARALWGGALLGAAGYEALKWGSTYLLQATRDQQAARVFGFALVLVVWMYYFSRLVLYSAAWSSTAGASPGDEPAEDAEPGEAELTVVSVRGGGPDAPARGRTVRMFLGGAGVGALVTLVAGRRRRP